MGIRLYIGAEYNYISNLIPNKVLAELVALSHHFCLLSLQVF